MTPKPPDYLWVPYQAQNPHRRTLPMASGFLHSSLGFYTILRTANFKPDQVESTAAIL